MTELVNIPIVLILNYLIVAATLLIISLLCAELIGRLWLKKNGGWFLWLPYRRLDLHLKKGVFPNFPPLTRVRINRFGARGEKPPRLDDETLRVVVSGGSAAECFFLDQPLTWPEQMAYFLRKAPPPARGGGSMVHVDNFGRSGYLCKDIERLLAHTAPGIGRIDVIVLLVGAGDMIRWMEQGGPKNGPEPGTGREIFALTPRPRSRWYRLGALKLLFTRARQWLTKSTSTRFEAGTRIENARTARQLQKHHLLALPDAQGMLSEFENTLRDLIGTCQQLAPRVVLVQQPHFGRLPSEAEQGLMWNFRNHQVSDQNEPCYYAHSDVMALMETINNTVARVGEQMSVTAIVDGQRAVTAGPESFYDFMHLNPSGAELLGKKVSRAIMLSHTANNVD